MYFLRPHDRAEGQCTQRRIAVPLLHGLSTTINFVFRVPEDFYSIQYSGVGQSNGAAKRLGRTAGSTGPIGDGEPQSNFLVRHPSRYMNGVSI
jgi:hypothetical protein